MASIIEILIPLLQSIQQLRQNLSLTRFSGLLSNELCAQCFTLQNKIVLRPESFPNTDEDISLLIAIENLARSCLDWITELASQPHMLFLTGDSQALMNIMNYKLVYNNLMTVMIEFSQRLKFDGDEDFSTFDVNEAFKSFVIKFELGNDTQCRTNQLSQPILHSFQLSSSFTAASALVKDEQSNPALNLITTASNNYIGSDDIDMDAPPMKIGQNLFTLPASCYQDYAKTYQTASQLVTDHMQLLSNESSNDNDILLALHSIDNSWISENCKLYREIMHQKHFQILIPRLFYLIAVTLFDEQNACFIHLYRIVVPLIFKIVDAWALKCYGRDCPTETLQRIVAGNQDGQSEDQSEKESDVYVRMIAAVLLLYLNADLFVDSILQSDIINLTLQSLGQQQQDESQANILYKCLFFFVYYKNDRLITSLVSSGVIHVLVTALMLVDPTTNNQRDYQIRTTLCFLMEHNASIADAVLEQLTIDQFTVLLYDNTLATTDHYFLATLLAHVSDKKAGLFNDLQKNGLLVPFLLQLLDTKQTKSITLLCKIIGDIGFEWLFLQHKVSAEPFIERIISLLCCEEEDEEEEKLNVTLTLVQMFCSSSSRIMEVQKSILCTSLATLIQATEFESIREIAEHILLTL